eukprot:g6451.t1
MCDLQHADSLLVNNTASRQGGGVYVKDKSSFTGFGTELNGNEVVAAVGDTTSDALGGAGLYIKGQGFLLSGLKTINSISEKGGAAFINKDAVGTFANSSFENNFATHSEGGGGIYIDAKCNVLFDRCTFKNNRATRGGGTTVAAATAVFTNSLFVGNKANIDGGGLWMKGEGCRVQCNNVTFAGNTAIAGNGGGITLTDSTTPLDPPEILFLNSKMVGNRAPLGNGGGLFVDKRMQATLVSSFITGGFYNNIWTKENVDDSFIWCRHIQTVYKFVPGQNYGTLERQPSFSLGHPVVKEWLEKKCVTKVQNALNGGGIYAGGFAKIVLTGTNISGANATSGGGLYVDKNANGKFNYVTVESNVAQFGSGAAFILSATADLQNSKFVSNIAQYDGAALYIEDSTVDIDGSDSYATVCYDVCRFSFN